MCSILLSVSGNFGRTKINKDLISIIREYLLPIKDKKKYSEVISLDYYSYFLRQCYFLQLKRTFPQKHKIYEEIRFDISKKDRKGYLFTENKYLYLYIAYEQNSVFLI